MRVYVVYFTSPAFLQRAFGRVMDCPDVVSCAVEAEFGRLRFIAPTDAADALVARIYLEGGLRWCSRHDFTIAPIGPRGRRRLGAATDCR